jgi:hypothetical protein
VSSNLTWTKSSYSGSQGGNCVEVARALPGLVAVRDSNDTEGPVLEFTPAQWLAFTAGIKHGRLGQA